MITETNICAYCEKEFIPTSPPLPDAEDVYCSFRCEVNALRSGIGRGIQWLGLSLIWGLVSLAFLVMLGQIIFSESISDPASYYALLVVLGLLTAILSILRQRWH